VNRCSSPAISAAGTTRRASDPCVSGGAWPHPQLYSPGVLGVASSAYNESSYSYTLDNSIGLTTVDRFSSHTVDFFERIDIASNATLQQWLATLTFAKLHSTAVLHTKMFRRAPPSQVLLTDFFGSVMKVELLSDGYPSFHGRPEGPASPVPPERQPDGRVAALEEEEEEEEGAAASKWEAVWRHAVTVSDVLAEVPLELSAAVFTGALMSLMAVSSAVGALG
jgi:hypothetical protein